MKQTKNTSVSEPFPVDRDPDGGAASISKWDFLQVWRKLRAKKIEPSPIPYLHRGTTINEDSIRICGSLTFI